MKFKNLRKACTVISFLLAAILITGTIIAGENATVINDALGAKSYEVVESGDGNVKLEDTIYFKSDFKTISEVQANSAKRMLEVVEEGTVLLKNENNALPLNKGAKISLVGVGAYDPVYGGTGSGGISATTQVNYEKSLTDAGFVLNPVLVNNYAPKDENGKAISAKNFEWGKYRRSSSGRYGTTKVLINEVPWNVFTEAAGDSIKEYGDAVIFVISRRGGEGYDLNGDCDGIDNHDGIGPDYLGLNQNELDTFNGLKAKKAAGEFKKLIVVINFSAMFEGEFLKDPAVDAAIWAGCPGGGNAVFGRIINGEVNPSGRLPDTMFTDNAKNPVNVNFGWWVYENAESLGVSTHVGTKNYPEVTLASYQVYQEGMYMGYRYTETRYEDVVLGTPKVGSYNYNDVVAYPFGHGLSYTTFDTSDVNVTKTGDREYEVSVKVTNTGSAAGKFSVPVYVSKPYNDYARKNGIQVPSVELVNFGKTGILAPGASETLKITLDEKFFASYDANEAKGYVLLGGDYYVAVGGSAHEAANNVLMAKSQNGVKIDTSKMVGTGDASKVKKFNIAYNRVKYQMSDAVSTIDGTRHIVTNLFDESDINRYSGRGNNHVDYYSRDNWEAVSLDQANGHATLLMTEQMAKEVYSQVPDQNGVYTGAPEVPTKYKQPLPTDNGTYPTMGAQHGLQLIDMMYDSEGNPISFFDPVWDQFLDQLTWEDLMDLCEHGQHLTRPVATVGKPGTKDENGPNGWTRMSYASSRNGNITSRANGLFYLYEKDAGHVKADDPNALDPEKIDANGTKSNTNAGFASNGVLSATFNQKLAYDVGNCLGNEGLWAGWSGIYGTGLNTHRSSYLGRTSEYFSECGTLAGLMGAEYSRGMEEKGVHMYNKHCALNELESCRHGIQVWLPEQALREIYLRAFELPIVKGGAFNTMASFSRFGTFSCAANTALAVDFLRNECGMRGIIVTDFYGDMNGNQNVDPYFEQVYGTYVGASDIPDGTTAGHFAKYETGYSKMAWAMRLAAKRLCYQTLWSNAMNGVSSTTRIVQITPWWQSLLTTLCWVFGVLAVACLGWTAAAYVLEFKKKKN
ncbi:MAG: glycoside hydrolase family 3 protein [Oscillospiraceae bacterium]|nr:glycoside hydrolase family 3 protein [Oscillospiraceae bacterium]